VSIYRALKLSEVSHARFRPLKILVFLNISCRYVYENDVSETI